MPRPESRSAQPRPNGIPHLLFQQTVVRVACNLGVDADLRRVLCRAVSAWYIFFSHALSLRSLDSTEFTEFFTLILRTKFQRHHKVMGRMVLHPDL